MTDNSSIPVDLRIRRKRIDIDDDKHSSKKKSRRHNDEIPLDLSFKSDQHSTAYSMSTPPIPPYNPSNLFLNSSALLYDMLLANLHSYYQQQQQVNPKFESVSAKSNKISNSRLIKDNSMSTKQESYACSCGERYSNVAQLVSHLKITNHSAQLSSTHDEVAKLVRGQDIWLSRDTNPANQILKCLRCSLSFETLPDLTAHMMKTNHFTQLLPSNNPYQHSNSKQSNSRLTCLVCSQQFGREVDLVDHLQRLHQIRFNCTTCGMYFENETIYKEHLLKEMHHRNGKMNKTRDNLISQCKPFQKRSNLIDMKLEQSKSRSSIDIEVERLTSDLVDRIVEQDKATSMNALTLLQNFVTTKTSSTTSFSNLNQSFDTDFNHLYDDENREQQNKSNISKETRSKSNESPLVSLEKMLAYSTSPIDTASLTNHEHRIKRKKFEKYRLFAEKMLRSTLS